jgi:hypothetical protein
MPAHPNIDPDLQVVDGSKTMDQLRFYRARQEPVWLPVIRRIS